MPEFTRAAIMEKPGRPVVVRDIPIPDLEEGAILLKTIFSEVCGTDCHLQKGKLSGVPYPLIPGHVSVGEIAAMRGRVTDHDGLPFAEGDKVAFLDVHETCGSCYYCLVAKASTRCPERRVYGITYGADEGPLGGWSEYIYLKPGVRILRLPEGVLPQTYIAGGCGLPTAFHAVERAGIRMGDSVVVQGSGPVGLNVLVFARLAGAAQVILLGSPERRLNLARQFGADACIDIADIGVEERTEKVLALTAGRGADVTIEACGHPAAVTEGIAMTRDNGRYVIVGQYTDNGSVEVNPHLEINRKHLDIRGCWGCDYSHLYRAIRMMGVHRERFAWEDMITKSYGLSETNEALSDVENLQVVKAAIDPWK